MVRITTDLLHTSLYHETAFGINYYCQLERNAFFENVFADAFEKSV